jgi:hypothetical protein
MEIIIPILAFGSLYVASNHNNKKKTKESFRGNNRLPNTDIPDRNFPNDDVDNTDTDLTSKLMTTSKIDKQSAYTDKFFNGVHSAGAASDPTQNKYKSITGDMVGESYFNHNNMKPFFGKKSHESYSSNALESTLDNYIGTGSQSIEKREQAPLFAPDNSTQWANGMPNSTEFIKSRINPSGNMAGVNPFKEQQVGPGLGVGDTTGGHGGYNSGMMARELWKEKSVDELRTLNNQKSSGLQTLDRGGPAMSSIKKRGHIGIVEKKGVDRHFELGSDRLFTTTGVQKNPTARSEHVARDVSRPDNSVEYAGIASGQSSTYLSGEFKDSTRAVLDAPPLSSAYAARKGAVIDTDYGNNSVYVSKNSRGENLQDDQYFGGIGGAIGAAIAPLMDILRPSKKENTIGNMRPCQNAKSRVNNSYVFNPADRPQPTIRDTTEKGNPYLNVNSNQRGGGYETRSVKLGGNQRDSTTDICYTGNASGGERGRQPRPYDAEYSQKNNDKKSAVIDGYMVSGNMSLFNSNMNVTSKNKDDYLRNTRPVQMTRSAGSTPNMESMGVRDTTSNLYQGIQYDRNNGDVLSQLKKNPYTQNILATI